MYRDDRYRGDGYKLIIKNMPSKGDFNKRIKLLIVLALFLALNIILLFVYFTISKTAENETGIIKNIETDTYLDENNLFDADNLDASSFAKILSAPSSSGSSSHSSSSSSSSSCSGSCGVGSIDKECKDYGFDFSVAKWGCGGSCCSGGNWTESLDDRKYPGTSVTGCCSNATWNAGSSSADGIVAKAGSKSITINGTNGTLGKIKGKDINHITFCGYNETQEYECGNGILENGEECDLGAENGVECTPGYDETCTYCSLDCKNKTKTDGYCGDGIIQEQYEECESDSDCEDPVCEDKCIGDDYYEYGITENECNGCSCEDNSCVVKNISYNDSRCLQTYCGNGIIDPGEECDDGNLNDSDECRDNCKLPYCGDLILDSGKQCEPPNTETCDADCMYRNLTCVEAESLGLLTGTINGWQGVVINNWIQDYDVGSAVYEKFDEIIDNQKLFDYDTGTVNGNSNLTLNIDLPDCKYQINLFCGEVLMSLNETGYGGRLIVAKAEGQKYCSEEPECGDGIKEGSEECDDGNLNNSDGCDSNCVVEYCGDGIVQENLGEECELPNTEDCDENCKIEICEHDVGIRYSYRNSFGTGIAIKPNGTNNWISDNPVELIQNQDYIIKYIIDNKIENTTNNIHVVVKMNNDVLANYNKSISIWHISDEIYLNTSGLSGHYNISVYIEKINEIDCNLSDNYAERGIIINAECGDSIINDNEQCEYDSDCNDQNVNTVDTCVGCDCKYEPITCDDNSDCGTNRWLEDLFCQNTNNLFDYWITYQCVNPGTLQSHCTNSTEEILKENCGTDSCDEWQNYCKNDDVWKNQTCYDKGCAFGGCFNNPFVNESFVEDCGDNSYSEVKYCQNDDVWKNVSEILRGCDDGSCFVADNSTSEKQEDCGDNSYGTWNNYCIGKEVWRNKTDILRGCEAGGCYEDDDYKNEKVETCLYDCADGNCTEAKCGNGIKEGSEKCDDGNLNNGDGCSSECKKEGFPPLVWMCDSRVWIDDEVQPNPLNQIRENNYAFEGEQIKWKVLVMDKNGIEKIKDVFVTIGDTQGEGNDMESNCNFIGTATKVNESCNARIGEEDLTGKDLSQVAGYYECTLTVETGESMYGQYWMSVEADDLSGLSGTMDENEFWFLNPLINLNIEGDLAFDDIMPGTTAYSDTIIVGNDADDLSGVILDMFIAGTNFYDDSSSGGMCPTSNVLALSNFRYYAINGYYNTEDLDTCGTRDKSDEEGYVGITAGNKIEQACEIIGNDKFLGSVNPRNTLAPGSEMALTFKLNMPEPCNGNFDNGNIYFWGEAI